MRSSRRAGTTSRRSSTSSAADQAAALDRTLQRERANAGHALSQQERKLTLERRDMVARQADRARAELARSIEQIQEQLEQRLTAWAADLDRGQRGARDAAERPRPAAGRGDQGVRGAARGRLGLPAHRDRGAAGRPRPPPRRAGEGRARGVRGRPGGDRGVRRGEPPRAPGDRGAAPRAGAEHPRAGRARGGGRDHADPLVLRGHRATAAGEPRPGARAGDAAARWTRPSGASTPRSRESREKSAQRLSHELEKAMQQFAEQAEKEIARPHRRGGPGIGRPPRAADRRHHARRRRPAGGRGRAAPADGRRLVRRARARPRNARAPGERKARPAGVGRPRPEA